MVRVDFFASLDKGDPIGLGLKARSTLRFGQVPKFDPMQPGAYQKVVTTGRPTVAVGTSSGRQR